MLFSILIAVLSAVYLLRWLGLKHSLLFCIGSFTLGSFLQLLKLDYAGAFAYILSGTLFICLVTFAVAQGLFLQIPKAGAFINGTPPFHRPLLKPLRFLAGLLLLALLVVTTGGSVMLTVYITRLMRNYIFHT